MKSKKSPKKAVGKKKVAASAAKKSKVKKTTVKVKAKSSKLPIKKVAKALSKTVTKGVKKAPPVPAKAVAQPAKKGPKSAPALVATTKPTPAVDVVLTNADGKQYCKEHDCDNEATSAGYCRFHYLALWKRNKVKAKILEGGKLDKYIEDLTGRYPDKYLEMLRKDLSSEKDFNAIVAEMDVEDSGDDVEAEEETSRFIEEVRGGVPSGDEDEGF